MKHLKLGLLILLVGAMAPASFGASDPELADEFVVTYSDLKAAILVAGDLLDSFGILRALDNEPMCNVNETQRHLTYVQYMQRNLRQAARRIENGGRFFDFEGEEFA